MVGISVEDLQRALRESLCVTPAISDQLRYMSSFDVLASVPRDATFAASDMTVLPLMDRFALLRDSLLTVLRLGLNDDVPEDAEPLNPISHLEASFNEILNKFRRFLITHYSVARGRMLVLAGVINRDNGLWESDLSALVRDKYERTMPPGASTAIKIFSLPTWKGMTNFVSGGGMLLVMQPLSPAPVPAPLSASSGGVDFNKRPAADGPCFIFLQHNCWGMKRCRYHHDSSDLTTPVAGSMGDNRHGSAWNGIAKPVTGGTCGNRNGLVGQCNGSDGIRNGSALRVGNTKTGRSSRSIVAWRGNRGGGGGHGGTRGGGGSSGGCGIASMSSSG